MGKDLITDLRFGKWKSKEDEKRGVISRCVTIPITESKHDWIERLWIKFRDYGNKKEFEDLIEFAKLYSKEFGNGSIDDEMFYLERKIAEFIKNRRYK